MAALSPEGALEQLYELMRDQHVNMRVRLNSAVSASRVEPLTMPGEEPTPAVAFLRNIIHVSHHGTRYNPEWRRQAGAALAYYERRAKKAELQYEVPDQDQRRAGWKRNLDSLLRQRLQADGKWPGSRAALAQPFAIPNADPELAVSALLMSAEQGTKPRQKAIDQPIGERITNRGQRVLVLRDVAVCLRERMAA